MSIRSIGLVFSGALILALGCGGEAEQPAVEEKAREAEAPRAVAPRDPHPVFVELVYEIADFPLSGDGPLGESRFLTLAGWVLDPRGEAATLYPARGEAVPQGAHRIWVGVRSIDHTAAHSVGQRTLLAREGDSVRIDAARHPPAAQLASLGALAAALWEPREVTVERGESGAVSILVDGREHIAVPAETALLAEEQRTWSRAELDEALGKLAEPRAVAALMRSRAPDADAWTRCTWA